jgi:hypothetical protein
MIISPLPPKSFLERLSGCAERGIQSSAISPENRKLNCSQTASEYQQGSENGTQRRPFSRTGIVAQAGHNTSVKQAYHPGELYGESGNSLHTKTQRPAIWLGVSYTKKLGADRYFFTSSLSTTPSLM